MWKDIQTLSSGDVPVSLKEFASSNVLYGRDGYSPASCF
jgi:hypothetical protein